jgi:calmodulin
MAFMRYRGLPQGEVTVEEFRAWQQRRSSTRTGGAAERAAQPERGEGRRRHEVGRLFDFAQRHLKVKITQLGYH